MREAFSMASPISVVVSDGWEQGQCKGTNHSLWTDPDSNVRSHDNPPSGYMVHHSASRQEEAQQWLRKATATIDEARPQRAGEPADAVYAADWIALEVLRREAEGLIEPSADEEVEQEESENGKPHKP